MKGSDEPTFSQSIILISAFKPTFSNPLSCKPAAEAVSEVRRLIVYSIEKTFFFTDQ